MKTTENKKVQRNEGSVGVKQELCGKHPLTFKPVPPTSGSSYGDKAGDERDIVRTVCWDHGVLRQTFGGRSQDPLRSPTLQSAGALCPPPTWETVGPRGSCNIK